MIGLYSNLFKIIRKYHLIDNKIKLKIVFLYGSESCTSYNAILHIINDFIIFFKEIDIIYKNVNENINGIINKNTNGNINGNINKNIEIIDENINKNVLNLLENKILEYFNYYINTKSLKLKNEKKIKKIYLKEYKNIKKGNFDHYYNCEIKTDKILINFDLTDGDDFNYNLLIENENNNDNFDIKFFFLFISTYENGSFPKNCIKLSNILEDLLNDFRVNKSYLNNIYYSCIGFGNKSYGNKYFCSPIKKCDKWFKLLGANNICNTLMLCDQENNEEYFYNYKLNIIKFFFFIYFFCDLININFFFSSWKKLFSISLSICNNLITKDNLTINKNKTIQMDTSDTTDYLNDCSDEIEDLISNSKQMLTNNQRNKLQKEGYKIIGNHSAVKLCRWTKSQLRGRGGCYKHSFYGINSYQCMEATPSLACANKCVFCWRHHKNPTGTEWKWVLDNAEYIVKESIKKHKELIKELKGVYGVIEERFKTAMNIRHCALSLVGEPIMYPEINKLIDELHKNNISTFLVTNAQFPDSLKTLNKVTQLYLSIDASNEESLKKIDKPLFKDFWKRYIKCIEILKERKERTVFRYTLVKEYNMMIEEIPAYVKLIKKGLPDFIEIKAVTYCGSSNGYNLTMKNIPWHNEVCEFAFNLIESSEYLKNIYEIACEHKHSCTILIAKKKFKINNKWHTWIDYDKFHQLIKEKKDFDSLDYCCETPLWTLYGSTEEGFNPNETRIYTKGKKKKQQKN